MSESLSSPDLPQPTGQRRLQSALLRPHPFNWRVTVVRLVVYGLALGLSSLILPGFDIKPIEGHEIYSVIILAAVFGVINVAFKPVLQFLALPFILETSGFVVVAINIVLFVLLDAFANPLMEIDGWWVFIVAGLFIWFFAFVLENVLGAPPPILSDIPPEEEEEETT